MAKMVGKYYHCQGNYLLISYASFLGWGYQLNCLTKWATLSFGPPKKCWPKRQFQFACVHIKNSEKKKKSLKKEKQNTIQI